ncbi:MAG: hypothetical protein ACKO4Y_01240, partial [Flavobacteriales bacterium]
VDEVIFKENLEEIFGKRPWEPAELIEDKDQLAEETVVEQEAPHAPENPTIESEDVEKDADDPETTGSDMRTTEE